jgi:hypothetical protein
MLWVNGYSGTIAQMLKLAPKTGRAYWGKNLNAAGSVLKDWNWMFIDPDISLISSPAARFKAGYHFALENERTIRNNILLNGNMFHIVAHGKGVAFAEGISAYFYEEKGIITDFAMYLQGTNLQYTPQSRRAVDCRIVCTNAGDILKKQAASLKFKDASIFENDLFNGFCRYAIILAGRESDHKTSHLYFKGAISGKRSQNLHFNRPFALWSSIGHAIKMYEKSELDSCSDKLLNVKNVMMFEKFSMN